MIFCMMIIVICGSVKLLLMHKQHPMKVSIISVWFMPYNLEFVVGAGAALVLIILSMVCKPMFRPFHLLRQEAKPSN